MHSSPVLSLLHPLPVCPLPFSQIKTFNGRSNHPHTEGADKYWRLFTTLAFLKLFIVDSKCLPFACCSKLFLVIFHHRRFLFTFANANISVNVCVSVCRLPLAQTVA